MASGLLARWLMVLAHAAPGSCSSLVPLVGCLPGEEVYSMGLATFQPKPDNMYQFMAEAQYDTDYSQYCQ